MYGVTSDKKKLKSSRERLEEIYKSIPATKGCMENNSISEMKGGCGSWCCKLQNPQVLYSEFLNSWNAISHSWNDSRFEDLINRCLRKYLFPNSDKGCVFLDKETNLCSQHETRPFNCRVYGITPEEEFKPRYERLKIIYPDARNQCNLVTTVDGNPVTQQDTEKWWLEINAVEMGIGIKKETINDGNGGSYRTYHDHILIQVLGESGMETLSNLRTKGSAQEKEHTIRSVIKALKNFKDKMNETRAGKTNASSEESTNP